MEIEVNCLEIKDVTWVHETSNAVKVKVAPPSTLTTLNHMLHESVFRAMEIVLQ